MTLYYVPSIVEIEAAEGVLMAAEKLGKEPNPDMVLIANWPKAEAAPYKSRIPIKEAFEVKAD